jgi:hypothetical protein
MLENWESLKKHEISEDKKANKPFPVGMMGESKVRIYFMHYPTFQEAKNKWNMRMARMKITYALCLRIGMVIWSWQNGLISFHLGIRSCLLIMIFQK